MDHLSGRPSEDLLILNVVFLSVTTVLLVLFGFKQTGTSVTSYTIGLVYVNLLLIAETIVLYGVSTLFQGKIKLYLVALGALAVAGIAVILIYPPLQAISQQGMTLLFGSSNFSIGVLNTAPLTLALAWDYFNVALILAAGGFLVLSVPQCKNKETGMDPPSGMVCIHAASHRQVPAVRLFLNSYHSPPQCDMHHRTVYLEENRWNGSFVWGTYFLTLPIKRTG